MSMWYSSILGRLGIILLLTGIVIALVTKIRSKTNTRFIDVNTAIYLGMGMAFVGVILLVVEFASN